MKQTCTSFPDPSGRRGNLELNRRLTSYIRWFAHCFLATLSAQGMNNMNDARQELQSIMEGVGRASSAMREITQWLYRNVVGYDVLPREMPEPLNANLAALSEEIDAVRRAAGRALSYFTPDPWVLLRGLPLSEEEYLRCRAQGALFGTAKEVGLASFDDYYVYQMLCYDDEKSLEYINVNQTPTDPTVYTDADGRTYEKVGMRYGLAPEECTRRQLRPEQERFFREHLPNVYARFSND